MKSIDQFFYLFIYFSFSFLKDERQSANRLDLIRVAFIMGCERRAHPSPPILLPSLSSDPTLHSRTSWRDFPSMSNVSSCFNILVSCCLYACCCFQANMANRERRHNALLYCRWDQYFCKLGVRPRVNYGYTWYNLRPYVRGVLREFFLSSYSKTYGLVPKTSYHIGINVYSLSLIFFLLFLFFLIIFSFLILPLFLVLFLPLFLFLFSPLMIPSVLLFFYLLRWNYAGRQWEVIFFFIFYLLFLFLLSLFLFFFVFNTFLSPQINSLRRS